MRTLNHPMILGLAAAFGLAGVAATAEAGSFYRYETEDGGIAWTDDAKRIPARYRDQAAVVENKGLDDFERFTPMAPSKPSTYAERLDDRLAHLREMNLRTVHPHASQSPSAGGAVIVRSGSAGNVVETHSGVEDGEPTVIRSLRVRPNGSHVTEKWTVVTQGDKVISVVRPQARHGSSRWLTERDLY